MAISDQHIGVVLTQILTLFSILTGASFKGKAMLHMESIFFQLVVAPLKRGFLYMETYSVVQTLSFDDKDTCTSILWICVFLLIIV